MNDLDERLAHCFVVAFPALSVESAPHATSDSVEEWDSVGAINLASVIGEEFGIEIDLERLPDLTTFDAFRRAVAEQLAG
jgi:acyl carrier protein